MATLTEADVARALRAADVTRIDVGNARLAHWKLGTGPDLVFVHGWPLHSATYRAVVPALADSFTCHLVDLPGAGRSQHDASNDFTLRGMAASLRRALDALGLARYGLVAHDSGAGIARFVAADDARVAGMVFGDTEIPGHTPWLIALYRTTLAVPGGVEVVRALLRLGAVRRSPLGFGGCFRDPRFVDGDFDGWFVRPLLTDRHYLDAQLGLLRHLDASEVERLRDVHAKIRVPVRLVWGTDDPIFPIAKARAMQSQFAGRVDWVEIPGARAFHHEDHADHFAAQVREHFTRVFA